MVCKDCHSFKIFGNKCWFFWENKKTCSQHRKSPESEPDFKTIEEIMSIKHN